MKFTHGDKVIDKYTRFTGRVTAMVVYATHVDCLVESHVPDDKRKPATEWFGEVRLEKYSHGD